MDGGGARKRFFKEFEASPDEAGGAKRMREEMLADDTPLPASAPASAASASAPASASASASAEASPEFHDVVVDALDALVKQAKAITDLTESLVLQSVKTTDMVAQLSKELQKVHREANFLCPTPPPLAPAFEQEPVSGPLDNPPLRPMQEWEKEAVQRWISMPNLSAVKRRGVVAIAEPSAGGSTSVVIDVVDYNDYTLWKLWHYLKNDVALEDVFTEAELDGARRATRRAPEMAIANPKAVRKMLRHSGLSREERLMALARDAEGLLQNSVVLAAGLRR